MRDAVEVFEQIREATQTIRKLPRVGVKNRFCNWPDFIRDYQMSFDPEHPDHNITPDDPFVPPTAKQIKEMDQVILWMAWLGTHPAYGEEYTRILWARAKDIPWRIIGKMVGLSKDTCRQRFRFGLVSLMHAVDKRLIK